MPRKSAKSILPNPGDAFLMPLADGRFGICRILRRTESGDETGLSAPHVLVIASAWIENDAPDMNDPRLREPLILTHHMHNHQPELFWTNDPLPETFRLLGTIAPTPDEAKQQCLTWSSWLSLPLQVYLQWRWDNEREAVLREDEIKQKAEALGREEGRKRYQQYLDSLTLEGLRKKRRFSDWKGFVDDEQLAACRKIFRRTIDGLIALGPKPRKAAVLRILRQCILDLNDLDAAGHFIDTIEREELCEQFEEIAHVCGIRGYDDLAGRWRDW